jgi:hypothetical protein
MELFPQKMKPLVVTLLALLAAIVVTLGVIQLRVWMSGNLGANNNSTMTNPSDAEKLRILASLSSTSSASTAEKAKTLHALSSSATTTPTDEEKLKILESLH